MFFYREGDHLKCHYALFTTIDTKITRKLNCIQFKGKKGEVIVFTKTV